MGTSRENQPSGDEEERDEVIPWDCVPYKVRQELIKRLNPDVTMSGNDWRMLACELGYTTRDISFIESEKENNTSCLFKKYDTKPGASFNEFYTSLEKMQRADCLDVLKDALPEIMRNHQVNQQSSLHQRAEMLEQPMPEGPLQWSGTSCPCPYPSLGSHCGGHAPCYPCSHGCVAGSHSHHVTSCPSPYHSPSVPPHFSMCQPHSHLHTHEKTFHQGFPSPVGQCVMGLGSPGHHGNGAPGYSMPAHQGQPSIPQGRPTFQSSPTYNYNDNDPVDSLVVESDPYSMTCRPLPSLHQHTNTNLSNGRVMVQEEVEIPAAVPQTLLRQQGPLSFHDIPLPNNINALDNSNLNSAGSSTTTDSMSRRQKVARQYSDECNVSHAGFSTDKRLRYNTSGRQGEDGMDALDNRGGIAPQDAAGRGERKPRNRQSPEFAYPGGKSGFSDPRDRQYQEVKPRNGPSSSCYTPRGHPNNTTPKTSLAYLENLATVPDRFKPTDEYKTVVAEQKIEDERRGHRNKDSMESTGSHSSSSSNGSTSGKNRPSLTFPMRMKPKTERQMEDLAALTISKKSSSMPENMKPAKYRKAFRHIKVFVTYSFDCDEHGRMVLSLCKFLSENGFACCVDVKEKKNSAQSLKHLDWCRKKVKEADFILVCISAKYLEDISPSHQPHASSHGNERQLHTREIYEMLNEEYLNNQQNSNDGNNDSGNSSNAPLPSRVVPLLFKNMTAGHIPPCMRNGPTYSWPNQYLDLAWMLTKPQERIQARRRGRAENTEEEEERRDNDHGGAMAMEIGQYGIEGVLCSS